MHTSQRGFIPLVAIVILGLIVAAGGTIATVSMRSSGEKPEPTKNEVVAATTEEAYSEPVSAQVESSEESERVVAPERISASVEADMEATVSIRPGTREICTEAQTKDASSGKSLIADIHVLCEQLIEGNYTDENVRDKEHVLTEKWQLWLIAEAQKRADEFAERDQQAQQNMKDALENPKPYVPLDSVQCLADKKALVPQIDSMYLKWYDEWQEARKGLDSCYATNTVPVCDKQMTEINVEWQNKLTLQLKPFYDQLTKCSFDERRFNDVSSVVPASY